ncbi:hypothetical protein DRP77_09020 [Candidatus Poribacteria bacterium]|nr:MAG: hypothetical protein DRP77_09020 [Candidatus Poribacteria bacterium]
MRRGLSLIATLWILAVLTVLATEFIYTAGIERRIDSNFLERTKMFYAAKAGFEETLLLLKPENDETPYDSLDEEWAQEREGEIEDALNEGVTYRYRVVVTDESARVNLNTADEGVLAAMLILAGADEETAKELASAIVQRRQQKPFRTVGELAEVEGMTKELLYGTEGYRSGASTSTMSQGTSQETGYPTGEEETATQQPIPLIQTLTVFSAARPVDPNAEERPININTADVDQLTGITDENGRQIFTKAEAEAIVEYRDKNPFRSIFDLLDVPAVSQSVYDQVKGRLKTSGKSDEKRININTADVNQLRSLPGFDEGVAEDVIRYRDQIGGYRSVGQIREAKVITEEELRSIADKITVYDDKPVPGLININTVPLEILAVLPGMDEEKAAAIVNARTVDQNNPESSGKPFQNLGELLDVEGINVETLKQIGPLLTCRSDVFRIESYGVAPDGKEVAYCMGIVDRSGQRVQIKFWRER